MEEPPCALLDFSLGVVREAIEVLDPLRLGEGHQRHVHVVRVAVLLNDECRAVENENESYRL